MNLLQTEIYFDRFIICAHNRACNRGTPQAKRLLVYYFNGDIQTGGNFGNMLVPCLFMYTHF